MKEWIDAQAKIAKEKYEIEQKNRDSEARKASTISSRAPFTWESIRQLIEEGIKLFNEKGPENGGKIDRVSHGELSLHIERTTGPDVRAHMDAQRGLIYVAIKNSKGIINSEFALDVDSGGTITLKEKNSPGRLLTFEEVAIRVLTPFWP